MMKYPNTYRQNVGIVVLKNNLIFAGFRADIHISSKYGWQMPQGGIDDNEDVLTASYRELYEETGIKKDKVKFIAQMPCTIKYKFTDEMIKNNTNPKWNFIGQEQHWIIFEFLGNETDINLQTFPEEIEFQKYDWKTAEFLEENVYEIKKNVYKELFNWMRKENFIL